MATQYQIQSVQSTGTSGRNQMVTVRFNGSTVTRHIIDGVGRHPDDTLPKQYQRLERAVADLKLPVGAITKTITAMETEIATNGPDKAEAIDKLPIYQDKLRVATAMLDAATTALHGLQQEHPIMVEYVNGPKNATD